jgi:hypothetical protein
MFKVEVLYGVKCIKMFMAKEIELHESGSEGFNVIFKKHPLKKKHKADVDYIVLHDGFAVFATGDIEVLIDKEACRDYFAGAKHLENLRRINKEQAEIDEMVDKDIAKQKPVNEEPEA